MIVIATAGYIAVVLLFGFLINTITVADAVTTITASTATIPTNTTTTTTTTDFNTIRGNTTGLVTHIVDGDNLN